MDLKDFTEVGYVKRPHGIRGEIFIRLFTKDPDWLKGYKTLFLAKGDIVKPFKINSVKHHKDGYIFNLKEVDNRNLSEELKGWTVMIPSKELLTFEDDDEFYLGEIIGFRVVDKALGMLGEILKFHFNGAQDLIVIERGGKEIEIPLVSPFIVDLNFQEKTIFMDLPPGLVDDAD